MYKHMIKYKQQFLASLVDSWDWRV